MKEEILNLRKSGKSYNQIKKILNCSKGTISYHCGHLQKEKTKNRKIKNNSILINSLKRRIDTFRGRTDNTKLFFQKSYIGRDDLHQKYIDKILKNPVCYLTGKQLDLNKSKEYCLDHIVPYSISKDNSVDNMGLCCVQANKSKSNMTIEEFIEVSKQVLINFGYDVIKKSENKIEKYD